MQVEIQRTGHRMALSPSLLAGWTELLPILLALLGTAGVFLLLKRLVSEDSGLYALLFERGWLQLVTTALFFWGLGHVIRRFLRQIGEASALNEGETLVRGASLKPNEIAELMHCLSPLKKSLVGPILSNVLSYFSAYRPSRDEVMQVAGQQIDWAQDRVDAEYKALNATMWLLPLSGFIGTLIGMSSAIDGFKEVLQNGGNAFSDLGPALSGLTTAFDTTLLALLFVIPLKICETFLHRRDQKLMREIDEAVGTGFVRSLDLGVIAQQSPEEAALDRFANGMARVDEALEQIDEMLAQIIGRLQTLPRMDDLVTAVRDAAETIIDYAPQLQGELTQIRQVSEQPVTLTRAPLQRIAQNEPPRPRRVEQPVSESELPKPVIVETPNRGVETASRGEEIERRRHQDPQFVQQRPVNERQRPAIQRQDPAMQRQLPAVQRQDPEMMRQQPRLEQKMPDPQAQRPRQGPSPRMPVQMLSDREIRQQGAERSAGIARQQMAKTEPLTSPVQEQNADMGKTMPQMGAYRPEMREHGMKTEPLDPLDRERLAVFEGEDTDP